MLGPIVSNVLWASLPEGALMLITLVSSHHYHNLWNVTCDVNCKLTTWQYFHHLVIAVSSCNETVALLQLSAPWPERTLFPVLSLARTLDTVLLLAGSTSSVTVHHHRLGQCHDISVVPECWPLIGQRWPETIYSGCHHQQSTLFTVNMECRLWFSYFWSISHLWLKCLLPWKG